MLTTVLVFIKRNCLWIDNEYRNDGEMNMFGDSDSLKQLVSYFIKHKIIIFGKFRDILR